MRRVLLIVLTTAALAVPALAAAAPASAAEGCYTPHLKGFNTVEVCVLPVDPQPR